MAFTPVGNTVSASLVYDWSGETVVNVLHYTKAAPWNLASMEELGEGIVAWWDTDMKSLMPDVIELVMVRIVNLETQTSEVLEYTDGLPLAGIQTDDAMPGNVALCITKRTAQRGRSFRGRIYHPAVRRVTVTGSYVNSTNAGLIANAYENAIVIDLPATVDEGLMCVVSYVQEGVKLAAGDVSVVTHMNFNTALDSQRRRLPGRGS